MGRTTSKSLTIDKDLVVWVEREMADKRYRSFSDAVNQGLRLLKIESERARNHKRA